MTNLIMFFETGVTVAEVTTWSLNTTVEPYKEYNSELFQIFGIDTEANGAPIDKLKDTWAGQPDDASAELVTELGYWGSDALRINHATLDEANAYPLEDIQHIGYIPVRQYGWLREDGAKVPNGALERVAESADVKIVNNDEAWDIFQNPRGDGIDYYTQVSWVPRYCDRWEHFARTTLTQLAAIANVDAVRIVWAEIADE